MSWPASASYRAVKTTTSSAEVPDGFCSFDTNVDRAVGSRRLRNAGEDGQVRCRDIAGEAQVDAGTRAAAWLVHREQRDQPAPAQDRDPVGQLLHLRQHMAGEKRRRAVRDQLPDQDLELVL